MNLIGTHGAAQGGNYDSWKLVLYYGRPSSISCRDESRERHNPVDAERNAALDRSFTTKVSGMVAFLLCELLIIIVLRVRNVAVCGMLVGTSFSVRNYTAAYTVRMARSLK